MRNDPITRALDVCLQYLQDGHTLEEALGLYPQLADDLRPLLETALVVRSYNQAIQTLEDAEARSRAKFLQAAQELSARRPALFTSISFRRMGLAFLTILFVLLVGAISTVVVSARSLPGQALYPVKLAAEHTRLLLTENQARRLALQQSYDQERLKEVEALIQRSSTQTVQFVGGLTKMGAEQWLVGGIPVQVNEQTRILGSISEGLFVEVQGVLQSNGTVLAQQVQVRQMDLSGTLQKVEANTWQVGNIPVQITDQTEIEGNPLPGSQVRVQAVMLLDGALQALRVQVIRLPIGQTGTPTPTTSLQTQPPVLLPSPPRPDETMEPSDTPKPSETPHPVESEPPRETQPPHPTESEGTTEASPTEHATGPARTSDPTGEHEHPNTPKPTDVYETEPALGPRQTPTPTPSGQPTKDKEHGKDEPTATPSPTSAIHPTGSIPPVTQTPQETEEH
jgi:hypothetical protein